MSHEASAPCQSSLNTGMAWSLLSEIHTLLGRLAQSGETSAIDLRSMPLTGADRAQLEALLGKGEVSAHLDVLGASDVWETGYSGVWWVRHMGAGDTVSSEEIAITPVPEILRAHPADIVAASERLEAALDTHVPTDSDRREEGEHV